MLIPRLIHQTTENISSLSDEFLQNIQNISRINPGWKISLYSAQDREDFIRTNYDAKVLGAYLSIDSDYGAARADLFRYLLIYKMGGLYLDIKSTSTKFLDGFISENDTFITANWPSYMDGVDLRKMEIHRELGYREYLSWFILSSPENIILEKVIIEVLKNIEQYSPMKFGVGKYGVLRTTGPIPYSIAVHPFVINGVARVADIEDIGLKYSIFNIQDLSLKHPGTRSKEHYTNLKIPVILKSKLRSEITAFMFSINHAAKRILFRVIKIIDLLNFKN